MADVNEIVTIPEDQIEEVSDADDAKGLGAFWGTVGASVGAGILGTLLFQKLRKAFHDAKIKKHECIKAEEKEIEEELARREEQTSDQDEPESDE